MEQQQQPPMEQQQQQQPMQQPPRQQQPEQHQQQPADARPEQQAAAAAKEEPRGCWRSFKASVKRLKSEVLALFYALHDPRMPWVAKLLPWLVLAYALSPLDLIPDFIPVLGLLDDMLLLPLGLWLSLRLIPHEVMDDARQRAAREPLRLRQSWPAAIVVCCLWAAALLAGEHWLLTAYAPQLRQLEWAVLAGSGAVVAAVFGVWLALQLRHEARARRRAAEALLPHDGAAAAV